MVFSWALLGIGRRDRGIRPVNRSAARIAVLFTRTTVANPADIGLMPG